jgi:predicted dehydrogenase
MNAPLGVGVIGAGPVTEAVHLPTLSTMDDRLPVVHVLDVNDAVAASVAARNADQVEASTKAGKRAILCEKPLAATVEQALRIADVSASSGVPVIVGAMHVHDPAYAAASQAWAQQADDVTLVRVATYLPSNDEMVEVSTELAHPRPLAYSLDHLADDPEIACRMLQ